MIDFELPQRAYGYRQEIISPLVRLLDEYLVRHSKVKVVRFDLHYPKNYEYPSSTHIQTAIANFIKKYKRRGFDPKYMWVMEQRESIHPHYHVALLLDAQKLRSYGHVFKNMEDAWANALGVDVAGCVDHCNKYLGEVDMLRNGLEIRHCDGEDEMNMQIQAVINQLSYLAKDRDKVIAKDGRRNFGMSRLGR